MLEVGVQVPPSSKNKIWYFKIDYQRVVVIPYIAQCHSKITDICEYLSPFYVVATINCLLLL